MKTRSRFIHTATALVVSGVASTAFASTNNSIAAAPIDFTRMIFSLVVIVGILIGMAMLYKKFGLNRMYTSLPFKVVGALHIGNNQRIVVMDTGEDWLVLGVTPHHISALTSLPRQDMTTNNAFEKTGDSPFAKWLGATLKKRP